MASFCWPSDLRIKTKADVMRFMDKTSGEMYFTDGVNDYCFEKRPKGEGEISYRSVTERGDIFSPYFGVSRDEAEQIIWKNRKAINEFLRR